MSDRQGIEIDYCPQCRGVWLDRGELDKIIERNAQFQSPSPTQDATIPQPQFLPSGPASAWLSSGQQAPGAPLFTGGSQGYDQRSDSGGYGGGGGHESGHGGGHGSDRGGHNNSFLGRLFR